MVRDSSHPLIPFFPNRCYLSLFLTCVVTLLNSPRVLAWGCRGHETIVLIALRDMTPMHAQVTNALLTKFPSATKIACREVPGMAVAAHESTWAACGFFDDDH